MKNIDWSDLALPCVLVAALLFVPAVIIGGAHMESRTFNRLTGSHTTWFDALWVELRVQEAPR
jgi:hypothetical protein